MDVLGLYIANNLATLTEWHKPFVKDLSIKWLIILKKYLTKDVDTILTEITILPSLAVKYREFLAHLYPIHVIGP